MSSFNGNAAHGGSVPSETEKPKELFRVMIPEGSLPGSDLNVQTEDGRQFLVTIPDKVRPGDVICLEVHQDAEGRSIVTIAEHESRNEGSSGSKAALGAAAVGAAVGFMVVGPLTAVVAGGAALYATTREDRIGDAARKTGSSAAKVYAKTVESAEKYHVKEKVSAATKSTVSAAKKINDDYHVTDSIKSATSGAVKTSRELNEKYDLTGKTKRASYSMAKSFASAFDKFNGAKDQDQSAQR